jgi:exoribonuclease-2
MLEHDLEPDWPPAALAELQSLGDAPVDGLRDLRSLLWSSIDNVESRDLDQVEVCLDAGDGRTRLLVGIADVDALVRRDSPIDGHAQLNTTSVYTPAQIFPMLPEPLSTDRTSLNESEDRPAVVVEIGVDRDGAIVEADVYRAVVHNHAKLAYPSVAAWLEGKGEPPPAVARIDGLADQIRLQDRIAQALRERREELGALDFDRREARPEMDGDRVGSVQAEVPNRARDLIEDVMIAANGVTGRFLASRGLASIRRVVRSPDRWPRIVDLAAQHGQHLPASPDARALQAFLRQRQAAAPELFADLSLAVIKLLGRGEYVADDPSAAPQHFALAVENYTHSTAPNRRFADLVTQRQLKAALGNQKAPYTRSALAALAEHCTRQEDAVNKVERLVRKAAAALWLSSQIGRRFDGVVTGASPKGTWVRISDPPVEGRLERGFEGLDVGDRVHVRLVHTDPDRGFIDFARAETRP